MIALVADIHGNAPALEAVLADIRRRGITTVFSLGDAVYGPLEPARTADLLMEAGIPNLRGNQDRIVVALPAEPWHPTLRYTLESLNGRHLTWLRDQPCTLEYGDLFLCHGTPSSDEAYLLEIVEPARVRLRHAEELAPVLDGIGQRVVACGHAHIPRVVEAAGHVIVNPGSVGLPAYADDLPYPHRMETGSPHARYGVIDGERIELIAVPYDFKAPAARARKNGREDWAIAIESGFAAP